MQSDLLSMMLCILLPVATASAAAEAPAVITFSSKQGSVTFNHKTHVESNPNCKSCHDHKGGKVKGLGKEWAHKVCKGCHEALMMGPVTCAGCHAPSRIK